MRIKLAILDNDSVYLNRIVSVFSTKYSDKFEIYSFTDKDVALNSLESSKIEVFISSDEFDIDVSNLPKRCGFAYLVTSNDIETVKGQRAISKFQKADLIYKQILSIYSENAGNVSGLKLGDEDTKVIAFCSPSGGTGCSTMAAACAMHFAAIGKKTLYLNLEKFGSSDLFLSAEGQFDMSDIIFALKSKKANLALKLESCVKQDLNGTYFYSQSKIALDMLELDNDETGRLITELKLTGGYDYLVVDIDFSMDKKFLDLLRSTHSIVWVGDGSDLSNLKIIRAFNALNTLEQKADSPITNRLSLIYNKFSNKTGKTVGEIGVNSLGGAPKYEQASVKQILTQLSNLNAFDKLI